MPPDTHGGIDRDMLIRSASFYAASGSGRGWPSRAELARDRCVVRAAALSVVGWRAWLAPSLNLSGYVNRAGCVDQRGADRCQVPENGVASHTKSALVVLFAVTTTVIVSAHDSAAAPASFESPPMTE